MISVKTFFEYSKHDVDSGVGAHIVHAITVEKVAVVTSPLVIIQSFPLREVS